MTPRQRSHPPVGQQKATPRRARKATAAPAPAQAPERDTATHHTADVPDPVMQQAKRDIDAGLVDTDMRATPGLDAALRTQLVPGPGGKPPVIKR